MDSLAALTLYLLFLGGVESRSDWSLLVDQIAHIDHVTGFCSCKILENRCKRVVSMLPGWRPNQIARNWSCACFPL